MSETLCSRCKWKIQEAREYIQMKKKKKKNSEPKHMLEYILYRQCKFQFRLWWSIHDTDVTT